MSDSSSHNNLFHGYGEQSSPDSGDTDDQSTDSSLKSDRLRYYNSETVGTFVPTTN